jgi:transcriptional regulator with XRE-family HTH domain
MAGNKGAAAARELGAELRNLRTTAGLNTRQLAGRVGVSHSNISHWETGNRLVPLDHLRPILDALDVGGDDRDRLLGLRRQAEGPGELSAGASSIGPLLADLIEHEQTAKRITTFALGTIPGLLQTTDYARAVLSKESDANIRVALRAGRRDILTRRPNPVEFVALIDSEVLVRPIAPPPVVIRQLEHLLEMAALPNVTIQLVPSTKPGWHPGLIGSFVMLEFPLAPSIVHVEHYRASATLWDEADVAAYVAAVEEIQKRAMAPDRTSGAIAKMLRGMESQDDRSA